MKPFGLAASGTTENVTTYDYNLVKLQRPGEEDAGEASVNDLMAQLKAKRTGAPAAGKTSSNGRATASWAEVFDRGIQAGVVGAAEAAASSKPGYRPPGLRDRATTAAEDTEATTTSLKVSNLSEEVAEEHLRALFMEFGDLKRVSVVKDSKGNSRGFAFVTFGRRDQAERAFETLRGTGFCSTILEIEWAKPPRSAGSSMRHASGYGGALPQG
jgi:hypothetical protein